MIKHSKCEPFCTFGHGSFVHSETCPRAAVAPPSAQKCQACGTPLAHSLSLPNYCPRSNCVMGYCDQPVSPPETTAPTATEPLRETFSRWSQRGVTDDGETPIDDYGKRILSMVIRALPVASSATPTPTTRSEIEKAYTRGFLDGNEAKIWGGYEALRAEAESRANAYADRAR